MNLGEASIVIRHRPALEVVDLADLKRHALDVS